MRAWAFMLAGLLVWAAHLTGVYAIASVADVVAAPNVGPARWAVGLLTAACAAADLGLLAAARRRANQAADGLGRFTTSTAGLGAGLSLVAVLWQGLPAAVAGS